MGSALFFSFFFFVERIQKYESIIMMDRITSEAVLEDTRAMATVEETGQ